MCDISIENQSKQIESIAFDYQNFTYLFISYYYPIFLSIFAYRTTFVHLEVLMSVSYTFCISEV